VVPRSIPITFAMRCTEGSRVRGFPRQYGRFGGWS
jgi:hypothetical protein